MSPSLVTGMRLMGDRGRRLFEDGLPYYITTSKIGIVLIICLQCLVFYLGVHRYVLVVIRMILDYIRQSRRTRVSTGGEWNLTVDELIPLGSKSTADLRGGTRGQGQQRVIRRRHLTLRKIDGKSVWIESYNPPVTRGLADDCGSRDFDLVYRFGKLYQINTRYRSRGHISNARKIIDRQSRPTAAGALSDRTSTTSKLCSSDVTPIRGRPSQHGGPSLRCRRDPAARDSDRASSVGRTSPTGMKITRRVASGYLHDNETTCGAARPRVKHQSALVDAHVNVFKNLVDKNMVDKTSGFEYRLVDNDDRMMMTSSTSSPDRCQRGHDRSVRRHQRRRVYVVRLGFVAWSEETRKLKPPSVNTETKMSLREHSSEGFDVVCKANNKVLPTSASWTANVLSTAASNGDETADDHAPDDHAMTIGVELSSNTDVGYFCQDCLSESSQSDTDVNTSQSSTLLETGNWSSVKGTKTSRPYQSQLPVPVGGNPSGRLVPSTQINIGICRVSSSTP